jgi:hypothetical protein
MTEIGIYDYKTSPYTGSRSQPDVIVLFAKENATSPVRFAPLLAPCNVFGMFPGVGFFIGAARIFVSVRQVFTECRSEKPKAREFITIGKNLARGTIELFPLVATIVLIAFEKLRITRSTKRIEKTISQQESIAGIAVGSHIICTFDVANVQEFYQKSISFNPAQRAYFPWFKRLILDTLQEADKKKISMEYLLPRIGTVISKKLYL